MELLVEGDDSSQNWMFIINWKLPFVVVKIVSWKFMKIMIFKANGYPKSMSGTLNSLSVVIRLLTKLGNMIQILGTSSNIIYGNIFRILFPVFWFGMLSLREYRILNYDIYP